MHRVVNLTVLSAFPDDKGFFHGYVKGDERRLEVGLDLSAPDRHWLGYVDGFYVATATTRGRTERLCIEWMRQHPTRNVQQRRG